MPQPLAHAQELGQRQQVRRAEARVQLEVSDVRKTQRDCHRRARLHLVPRAKLKVHIYDVVNEHGRRCVRCGGNSGHSSCLGVCWASACSWPPKLRRATSRRNQLAAKCQGLVTSAGFGAVVASIPAAIGAEANDVHCPPFWSHPRSSHTKPTCRACPQSPWCVVRRAGRGRSACPPRSREIQPAPGNSASSLRRRLHDASLATFLRRRAVGRDSFLRPRGSRASRPWGALRQSRMVSCSRANRRPVGRSRRQAPCDRGACMSPCRRGDRRGEPGRDRRGRSARG